MKSLSLHYQQVDSWVEPVSKPPHPLVILLGVGFLWGTDIVSGVFQKDGASVLAFGFLLGITGLYLTISLIAQRIQYYELIRHGKRVIAGRLQVAIDPDDKDNGSTPHELYYEYSTVNGRVIKGWKRLTEGEANLWTKRIQNAIPVTVYYNAKKPTYHALRPT